MSYLIQSKSELSALKELYQLLIDSGENNGNNIEVLSCLVSIAYNETEWHKFVKFRKAYTDIGGYFINKAIIRANRVYGTLQDKPSKPSYPKRLIQFKEKIKKNNKTFDIDQISKISNDLVKKPGLGNLAFVVFRPADLFDQFRPGYVPCLIAGDIKFRDGLLYLNAFFRTNDTFLLAYSDIYYLRKLQLDILQRAKLLTKNKKLIQGEVGNLNIYFSRIFMQKSLKDEMGNRKRIIPIIKNILSEISNNWD